MNRFVQKLLPENLDLRAELRLGLLRALVAANLLLGLLYLSWRSTATIN